MEGEKAWPAALLKLARRLNNFDFYGKKLLIYYFNLCRIID